MNRIKFKPSGWAPRPLVDYVNLGLIELGRGEIISHNDMAETPGPYPVYSSSAARKGQIGTYGKYMFDEELITWSIDGGGRFFYRPKHKFSVTNVSGYLRILTDLLDYKYLYYLLDFQHSYLTFDYILKAHPSVIVNWYEILELPLAEQRLIAEILDTVDEAIRQTEKLIAKLKQIKAGLLHDLLTRGLDEEGRLRDPVAHPEQFKETELGRLPAGWEIQQVGEVFDMQLGKMLSKAAKTGRNPFPYLANRNVQWDRVDLSDLPTMDFSDEERAKYSLREGDLLVCEGGEIGRTAIWRGEMENCYYQKAIHRLRPKDGRILPEFMLRYMHRAVHESYFAKLTSQTSIAHLTQEKLELLSVPLPPIDEQQAIVEVFEAHDARIEAEAAYCDKLTKLKQGLMQDLLTGRVRVTDVALDWLKGLMRR